MKELQIFVFGDSITYGAWDEGGGWVARLRRFLDKKQLAEPDKFYLMVYNLGVDGDTSEDVLKRFQAEVKHRLDEGLETLVIFAIGINDSHFSKSRRALRMTPDTFKTNLQKLAKLARKITSNIIFVGATPVDESKTNPVPWDKDVVYQNKQISKDDEIIKEVCKENKLAFVRLFGEWLAMDYRKVLSDGVHPNAKGHKMIFEAVKPIVLRYL